MGAPALLIATAPLPLDLHLVGTGGSKMELFVPATRLPAAPPTEVRAALDIALALGGNIGDCLLHLLSLELAGTMTVRSQWSTSITICWVHTISALTYAGREDSVSSRRTFLNTRSSCWSFDTSW